MKTPAAFTVDGDTVPLVVVNPSPDTCNNKGNIKAALFVPIVCIIFH